MTTNAVARAVTSAHPTSLSLAVSMATVCGELAGVEGGHRLYSSSVSHRGLRQEVVVPGVHLGAVGNDLGAIPRSCAASSRMYSSAIRLEAVTRFAAVLC